MAKTFSSKKVQVSFKGQRLTGLADGDFVSAEMNSDAFSLVKGADGEGARAASADDSGKVTLTFLQTSIANDILSAALAADRLSEASPGELFIKDVSGRTRVHSGEAWVVKSANVDLGKDVKGREWVLECDVLEMIVGGN